MQVGGGVKLLFYVEGGRTFNSRSTGWEPLVREKYLMSSLIKDARKISINHRRSLFKRHVI